MTTAVAEPERTGDRTLGRTGAPVLPVSLGGEGILRTTGRAKEAVPVIVEALRLGVRYCDTAPAYQQSQDYYGEAFRALGPAARRGVFLASKTHERTRDRALRLLDDSLRRDAYRAAVKARIDWDPVDPYHVFAVDIDSAGFVTFAEPRFGLAGEVGGETRRWEQREA